MERKTGVKTIEEAAHLIRGADALLVFSGAGMSVDSGLPAFYGKLAMKDWPGFRYGQHSYADICNPKWFHDAEKACDAWAFWKWCYNCYKDAIPHTGYAIVKKWGENLPLGSWCSTTNIDSLWEKAGWPQETLYELHGAVKNLQCSDPSCKQEVWSDPSMFEDMLFMHPRHHDIKLMHGQLPTCPTCGAIARPNVLMFGEDNKYWHSSKTGVVKRKINDWIASLRKRCDHKDLRLVILEVGCGNTVPGLRRRSEQVFRGLANARMIRINVEHFNTPPGFSDFCLSFPEKAYTVLKGIDKKVKQMQGARIQEGFFKAAFTFVDKFNNTGIVVAPSYLTPSHLLVLLEREGVKLQFFKDTTPAAIYSSHGQHDGDDTFLSSLPNASEDVATLPATSITEGLRVEGMTNCVPTTYWRRSFNEGLKFLRMHFPGKLEDEPVPAAGGALFFLEHVHFENVPDALLLRREFLPGASLFSVFVCDGNEEAPNVRIWEYMPSTSQLSTWIQAGRSKLTSDAVVQELQNLECHLKERDDQHRRREAYLQQAQSCEAQNRNAIQGVMKALGVCESKILHLTSTSDAEATLLSVKSHKNMFHASIDVDDLGIAVLNVHDVLNSHHPTHAYAIVGVRPESWAESVGMRSGNRIKTLNGKPVAAWKPIDLMHFLDHRPLWIETWSVHYCEEPTSPESMIHLEELLLKEVTAGGVTPGIAQLGPSTPEMPAKRACLGPRISAPYTPRMPGEAATPLVLVVGKAGEGAKI